MPQTSRTFLRTPVSAGTVRFDCRIKYDLMKAEELPRSQRAVVSRKPAARKQNPPKHEEHFFAPAGNKK